jgi:hypothetical protein
MDKIIQQGIGQLIYATFLHNNEIIAFSLGILITLFLLFRRPRRVYLFFLIAFVCLLIRFEYLKHIVDPLSQQTIGVVVTEEGHWRTRKWLDLFFNNFIPLVLYLLGWGSMFIGLFLTSLDDEAERR